MTTVTDFVPPAVTRAASLVRAQSRHLAFLLRQTATVPPAKMARHDALIAEARAELARRQAMEAEVRSEAANARQIALFAA